MVLIQGSRRLWLASTVVSLVIFLIVYLTVIRPDQNTANQAVKAGLQQSQQVINQAKKALGNAGAQATGAAGNASGATSKAISQGQQALSKAQKLTACVASAGTDASKLAACQSKYSG
ncbi:MAG TPA: hypothetical protein VFN55_05415 [Solirubrobacteraceae bacterium]|nr:hypothetical protein [Solirubrobacteraceae bacterium]